MRHLVFRFGIREFHLEALFDTAFTGKEREDYRDFLQSLRAVFRSLGVNGVLYGPGLHLTADGANLARCMGARPGLDCYTIRCAPVGIVRAAEVQVRSIPEADYLDAIMEDVAGAREEIADNTMYLTLNLARVLAYRQEGLVLSKKEGGEWALKHLPPAHHPLIRAALADYESDEPVCYDPDAARRYADDMLGYLTRQGDDGR